MKAILLREYYTSEIIFGIFQSTSAVFQFLKDILHVKVLLDNIWASRKRQTSWKSTEPRPKPSESKPHTGMETGPSPGREVKPEPGIGPAQREGERRTGYVGNLSLALKDERQGVTLAVRQTCKSIMHLFLSSMFSFGFSPDGMSKALLHSFCK